MNTHACYRHMWYLYYLGRRIPLKVRGRCLFRVLLAESSCKHALLKGARA